MDLQLAGKRALVTGSSAGIGASVALRLAAEGADVVVQGRHAERAEGVAARIRALGARADVALGDLARPDEANAVADAAMAGGAVDILVNNAGQYPWHGFFDGDPQEWLDTYDTDVVSNVRLIQRLAPPMRERGWGRILMLSSASGTHPPANNAPMYACAKAAQTHLAKCLATELSGSGVTVNAVCPAPVVTKTTIELFAKAEREAGRPDDLASVQERFVNTVMNDPPVRRMATAEEVAALVAYLASPLADPITGSEHLIDCGFSVTGFRRQVAGGPASGDGPIQRPSSTPEPRLVAEPA